MPSKPALSKWIRRTHLLVALFLTPWILMYAVSTITMHHRAAFTGAEHRIEPEFELVEERTVSVDAASGDRDAVALRVLAELGLDGAHSIRGDLTDDFITIHRDRPIASYRISYRPHSGLARVERQGFDVVYVLEMLHRRRGFDQTFLPNDLWALVVDGVVVAILAWAATGLWMWWEMKRTRVIGAVCLVAGSALFAVFLMTL